MPNYCFNSMVIRGDKDRIKEFHDRWLSPEDPLYSKVTLPTLRVLDMCALYGLMEKKLDKKHGKSTFGEIINFAYDNITDIDFLDDRANELAYPYYPGAKEFNSFNDYFKAFLKNVYNIMTMTPKQRENRRLLRNKWYDDNCQKYSFHNLVTPSPVIPYRDGMPVPKDNGNGIFNEQISAYYFNLKNIGQKWTFPSDIHFEWDSIADGVICSFETAWSPADVFIAKISKMYPDLEFELEFNESGVLLAGYVIYFNGDLIKQDWYDGDSYAGFQLFQDYAEEDVVHDLRINMEMTVPEILNDCEGHISKDDVYKYLGIRKAKVTRLDKI